MNLEGLKKSMKQQEGQRSVKKYIVLFILLVLVVIFIVLKGADIESVWNAMKNADPKWLTAGLGLAAVFNIAEGINLRKVLVSFGYRVSFKEAMKYAYIGYFFSSVTPSATGGQPLQLYAMSKDKIHVAHGTMALLTELTSFQIAAFLMENIAAFWILTGRIHLNKIMLILALVGYIMNLVFIAALMIVIVSDRLKRKIVKGIRFLVMKLPFRHKEKMESKINDILHDFENCKDFLKRSKPYITGNWGEPGTDYLLVQRSVGSISCNGRSRQYIWKSFFTSDYIIYDNSASSVSGSGRNQ